MTSKFLEGDKVAEYILSKDSGITSDDFLYVVSKFPEHSVIDALMLMAESVAKKRYPEVYEGCKMAAVLKFFQEFTKAGEDVYDNCFADCEDNEVGPRKKGIHPEYICDDAADLADALAPEGMSEDDKFLFGVCILQDIVECASEVV